MKRYSQEDMARVIGIANKLAERGILFVPIPVLEDDELPALLEECDRRIARLTSEILRPGKGE